jgi:Tfp pilus assembly PilM family ATPase
MDITTLNISSGAIKFLVTRGDRAIKHGSVPPASPIKNGLMAQPDIIADQLKSLFASHELPRRRVICNVNGLPFSYRLFTLPKMAPETFNEAILRVTKKEMPMAPEEMYLSWQAYPAEKEEWQILVTGIARQPIDNLIAVLTKAGIKPSFLDLPHLSLARLANQKDAIIVDLEKDYSNIVMMVEGVPVGMQIVPSLGPEAARQDEVGQVTDRLTKMVEFYNGNHPRQPIQETVKVILTGELFSEDGLAKIIQEETLYPVEPLRPKDKVFSDLPWHEYAANAGAALLDVIPGKEAVGAAPYRRINLGEIAKERRGGIKSVDIIKGLAISLAIIAGVTGLVLSYRSQNQLQAGIAQLQADIAQANTEYSQLLESVNQAQAFKNNIGEIEASIQKINAENQAVLSSKNYVTDISLIVQATPEGIAFSSMDINGAQIILLGGASAAAQVVQFARNLEASGAYAEANINWIDRPKSKNPGINYSFMIAINR